MNPDTGRVAELLSKMDAKQTDKALQKLNRLVRGVPDKHLPRSQTKDDAHKRLETWQLGDEIQSPGQLNLALAVLKRLKRASKSISTPETALENRKCLALCRQSIDSYRSKSK